MSDNLYLYSQYTQWITKPKISKSLLHNKAPCLLNKPCNNVFTFTGAIGAAAGSLYATNMADYTGWRSVFFVFGAISLSIGGFNFMFAKDPRRDVNLSK